MERQVHILNGDSLKEQIPSTISGDKIIFRECLVEGRVNFNGDFYKKRAKTISEAYGSEFEKEYFDLTVPELEKLDQIPSDRAVNLWFEEDLFCQVNLWYVIDRLKRIPNPIYLILPNGTTLEFGFSGMIDSDFIIAFSNKMRVDSSSIMQFSRLWKAYQRGDLDRMSAIGSDLGSEFGFVSTAVSAYKASVPENGYPGRPKEALTEIMKELETRDFGPVFREFTKRESIYGYGDLQVKRLFDELLQES